MSPGEKHLDVNDSPVKTVVILVGIGGATCSGKTTLAKHLRRILPDSVIIHQDDFAPPQELIPIHPVYGVQDWDAAPGAIEWPRLISFLQQVKATGTIPPEHISHDHLNEQRPVHLEDGTEERWRKVFEKIASERKQNGENIIWGLLDGFLLYWHPEVIAQLDVRIFLRVPHDILKKRRHERHGYHTAVQTDPEGTLWRDPPNYWEQIVFPAYIDAHCDIFQNGDIENGQPVQGESAKVPGLMVLDMWPKDERTNIGIDDAVGRCCETLLGQVRNTRSSSQGS